MKDAPDLDGLPSTTPPQIRWLLRRCLAKDPRRRLQAIGEARLALEDPDELALPVPSAAPSAAGRARPARAFAAVLAIALAATSALLWRAMRPREHPLLRLNLDLGPEAIPGARATFALSPDGQRLVFLARAPDGSQHLAMRPLNETQSIVLAGTENARDPFFSPDGQWIGFFVETYLKKVSVQGGTPVTLGRTGNLSMGGSWGEDGAIVEVPNPLGVLTRVPSSGGVPERLTKLGSGEATHRWPQVLPGGKEVLFTAAASFDGMDDANIEAEDFRTGTVKLVQRGGYYGRSLPSGHLLYVHRGVLFGVPFDASRLEARGSPVRLLDDLAANGARGAGQFAVSSGPSGTGMLVYLAGKPTEQRWSVSWLDKSGRLQPLISAPSTYFNPAFSPDGRRLALDAGTNGGIDIFVYDLVRENMVRLTSDGASDRPLWTPDGEHIVYQSSASGHGLWWIRADGAQRPQLLLNTPTTLIPTSFSPDGRRLACWEMTEGDSGQDIWILPLEMSDPDHPRAGAPTPFLRTPANEYVPVFSPDGRWIAYTSDESGNWEVYVRPASGANGKTPISNSGGRLPIWSRNGRELFYEALDNRIMTLEYTASSDSFHPGKPRVWCDRPIYSPGRLNLDLAPDGKRFAVMQAMEPASSASDAMHVVVLLNVFDELKRRMPTR
jgi:serine/threonine-protein kinase